MNGKIIIKDDTKKLSSSEAKKHFRLLNNMSILTSINGTIGNVAYYNNEPVVLGKSVCFFNLITGIKKDYLRLLLKTDYYLKYAMKVATGTTIKNVPLKGIRDYLVPVPPLSEQQRIVEKIEALMPMINAL